MPNPTSEEQAREWIRNGLGMAYQRIAYDCSAPVFWLDPSGGGEPVGGTCFFVDSGARTFGMTAGHVLKARSDGRVCRLFNSIIDPSQRVMSLDEGLDVATFEVTEAEVRTLGKYCHTAIDWPPALPERGKGVFFGGYRKRERTRFPDGSFEAGFAGALTIAEDATGERLIANLDFVGEIEERTLRPIEAGEDWGGANGGPVFTVVAGTNLDSWRLAGVLKNQVGAWDSFVFCSVSRIAADGTIRAPE